MGGPNRSFGFDANQTNLSPEILFPTLQGVINIVKNNSISSSPNDPASCYDNSPENVTTKVISGFDNHVQRLQLKILGNAAKTERTFKEKVHASLFTGAITENTRVIIKVPIFPGRVNPAPMIFPALTAVPVRAPIIPASFPSAPRRGYQRVRAPNFFICNG